MTALTSFRGAPSAEFVGPHSETTRIQATFEGDGRKLDFAMNVAEGRRTWSINDKPRHAKDMRATLPSVAFTPDDLQLVKSSNKARRHELDVLGGQLNGNYLQISRDFEKILRHKNRLLKDEAPDDVLAAVNDVFAKVGAQLTNYREALFARLMPKAAAYYSEIAGEEELTGTYAPSSLEEISALVSEERARKRALAGPHLDQIAFAINGMDATSFASQGQQRSIVLALKLAEVDLVEEMFGQPPVLLLDDVMSELDESRRAALVTRLAAGTQTFITTANLDYFDAQMLEKARLIAL